MYRNIPRLLLAMLCLVTNIQAQETLNLNEPKDYEIGGITVFGATHSDRQAIIAVSGLEIGDKIRIPSNATNQAIKALWKLQLFTDVQIGIEKTVGEVVFLQILVQEQARYFGHTLTGIKPAERDELDSEIQKTIRSGSVFTPHIEQQIQHTIQDYFIKKGYFDVVTSITQIPDNQSINQTTLQIIIDKKERIKIKSITFTGNKQRTDKQLRKSFQHTQQKSKLFTSSKYIPELFEQDKKALIAAYHRLGYRDAQIIKTDLKRDADSLITMKITIEEGESYYFGNITWKGNQKYLDAQLSRNLGIQTGDPFNPERLEERLRFSPDGTDISSIYMDAGHLFFQMEAIEKAIHGQQIDLEIQMMEGAVATIDKITITGNDITNEAVIRRELRTKPGEKFSRSDIIRSQRELISLNYFNPENLGIDTKVNPERGTVDIEYSVEEKQSDKLELAGGWGGSNVGVTGTVGVALNNFSLKKFLSFKDWQGLPRGDGQQLSLRVQSNGAAYQSYNFSFTEPWLGDKKPNALSFGIFHNRYLDSDASELGDGTLRLTGANLRYGTRLNWPDDYFTYSASINFQKYQLNNWSSGLFHTDEGDIVTDGNFYNINLTQQIARSTIDNPIYPHSGSRFSLTLKLTPPYSLFNSQSTEGQTIAEQYKFLEYHKWRFDAEWYTSIIGDLVFKAGFKIGYLGSYNSTLGTSPFERFQLGGDGLNGQGVGFQGTDIISLRGYDISDLENNLVNDETTATAMFQKITAELRYPLIQTAGVSAYGLGFFEAGNSFESLADYQPFQLQRSVGLGLRVFLPMFGTLGFDYGWGFDKNLPESISGGYGKFSIILGQEPE